MFEILRVLIDLDDVHHVEELIKDQNVDTADGRGRTALHVAAEAGKITKLVKNMD